MTFFIFAGDMLVMLFMTVLVVWLYWRMPDDALDASARIPLEDENPDG
jgi:cbb3-type cytochrome oxidase subunit 3